jgi:hypothetical protein
MTNEMFRKKGGNKFTQSKVLQYVQPLLLYEAKLRIFRGFSACLMLLCPFYSLLEEVKHSKEIGEFQYERGRAACALLIDRSQSGST